MHGANKEKWRNQREKGETRREKQRIGEKWEKCNDEGERRERQEKKNGGITQIHSLHTIIIITYLKATLNNLQTLKPNIRVEHNGSVLGEKRSTPFHPSGF